ncbi:MAG: glycosyltransferase family 2 protein [Verrucomicrobiae bacterium]|nr:glycosyltransferase family 2 protein [Verrucomicrobiae bacterium]
MTELSSTGNAAVAIPARDEAAHLGAIVRGCRALGFEVWVVDDGSDDDTGEIARREGAEVLRHATSLGKGAAIRTALRRFLASKRGALVLMDADGQHDPRFAPEFLRAAAVADLVLGNRMGNPGAMPPVRRWTNRAMSLFLSRMCGAAIPDSQCGYRLLSRRFAEAFRPTTSHFELESEMLVQAARFGFKITSVPIPAVYGSSPSHIRPIRDTLRFLGFLAKARFSIR